MPPPTLNPIYDEIGVDYGSVRRPDPRIAQSIRAAIGDIKTLVNVGAGSGSYEPADIGVIAVEPSEVMIRQRSRVAAPVVRGRAENLPFADGAFDVATAILTVHHWSDAALGLTELARVSKRQVIMTWDPEVTFEQFWFARDYFPKSIEADNDLATLGDILEIVGGNAEVTTVPVPADCCDGFYAAYWARPDAYLDPAVRAAISAFTLNDQGDVAAAIAALDADIRSGAWDERYGHMRQGKTIDAGYRLVNVS